VLVASCGGTEPVESNATLPLIPVPSVADGGSSGTSGNPSSDTPPESGGPSTSPEGADLSDAQDAAGVPLAGERPVSGLVVPPPPSLPATPPPRPSPEDIANRRLTQAQVDEVIAALRAVTGFFNADQGSLDEKVAFVQNGTEFAEYMSSVSYVANRPGVYAKVSFFELVYEGGCSQVYTFSGVPVPEPCIAVELEFWQGDDMLRSGLVVYTYRDASGWRLAQESFCYVAWSASPSDPPCSGF
jgi:hypothetical protein